MSERPRPTPPRKAAAPRRRRTAEEAREAILDVAERMLVASGPGALRLQQVAHEVGVSHPTVLHHFGSREALVEAVIARAAASLSADVVEALGREPAGEGEVALLLDRIFATLGAKGHARALAWMALSGEGPELSGLLDEVARVVHALRRERHRTAAPLADTRALVQLTFLALFGQAVVGGSLERAGAEGRGDERFRRWLATLLVRHLGQ